MNKRISGNRDEVILRFMESTIEKVNLALSGLYAVEKILIEKKIVPEGELLERLNDAKALPKRLVGVKTLQEMIDSYKNDDNDGALHSTTTSERNTLWQV